MVTWTCSVSILDSAGLSQAANLLGNLKLCVGVRVMGADNINVSGRLLMVQLLQLSN